MTQSSCSTEHPPCNLSLFTSTVSTTSINSSRRRGIIRTVSQGEHSNAKSLVRKPFPFKQPPPEILLEIFKFALPPPVFLNASIIPGSSSPWCLALRIKKNIVLVCKLWCQIGTFLIYQDVHLRRIGHVAALLNTLQGNPRLGIMIETINVSCYIIPQCSVMFDEALQQILEMSPTATQLSLKMNVCATLTTSTRKYYDLSRVVHLEVGEAFLLDVLPCLAQCKNLVILSIEVSDADTLPTLTLEHLQELQISWGYLSPKCTDLKVLDVTARKWIMPRLRCFTLHYAQLMGHETPEYINFLNAHGKNLTTLSITAHSLTRMAFEIKDVQMFLDRCPALEHLAVCWPTSENWGVALSHKSLRWIDIWASRYFPSPFTPDFSILVRALKAQEFPQLQGIRVFDWPLLTAAGPRLHLIIPPGSVQQHETLQWRFPGIDVLHYRGNIYKEDMQCVTSFTAACDAYAQQTVDSDSDDSSFNSFSSPSHTVYDSDSDEGDSEMFEDFTRDSDASDSKNETAIDLDTTLQIYRDILNAESDL